MLHPPCQVLTMGTEGSKQGTNKLHKHSKSKTLGGHEAFSHAAEVSQVHQSWGSSTTETVAMTLPRQAARGLNNPKYLREGGSMTWECATSSSQGTEHGGFLLH